MPENMLIIDAHIHIHECFDIEKFFDFAWDNFQYQAVKLQAGSFTGVLCLTEKSGTDVFGTLEKIAAEQEKTGDWDIRFTEEENSLLLSKNDFRMIVIAGRQIVTSQKLEVLAIGLKQDVEDGKPIEPILAYVVETGAIPVIPWGFGKWFSGRRKIMEKIISQKKYPFFLGDNGNRPWIFTKPRLIRKAYKNNILNLPGSDPLPYCREIHKPGSFGLYVEAGINTDKPFESIYQVLTTGGQPETYGKSEKIYFFLKNQISIQLAKRNRK